MRGGEEAAAALKLLALAPRPTRVAGVAGVAAGLGDAASAGIPGVGTARWGQRRHPWRRNRAMGPGDGERPGDGEASAGARARGLRLGGRRRGYQSGSVGRRSWKGQDEGYTIVMRSLKQ